MSQQDHQDSDDSQFSLAASEESMGEPNDLVKDIEDELRGKVPPKEQAQVLEVVREVVRRKAAYFSGPQPPPELIAEYEKVAPGWGLRILEMGEREQLHRHGCDNKILNQTSLEIEQNSNWLSYMGRAQIFGFAALLVVAGIAVYAIYLHETTVAGIALGTAAVGAVTAFVRGPAKEPAKSDHKNGPSAESSKSLGPPSK